MLNHPERHSRVQSLYAKASAGDSEAMLFLREFDNYLDSIRTFLNSGSNDPQRFIGLMAKSNFTFSCPYYVKHAGVLYLIVQRSIGLVLDGEPMKEIVLAVANLKLGFSGARELIPELNELVAACKSVDKTEQKA